MSTHVGSLPLAARPRARWQFGLGELVMCVWLVAVILLAFFENIDTPLLAPVIVQTLFCIVGVALLFSAPPGSSRNVLRSNSHLLLPGLLWMHLNWLLNKAVGWLPVLGENLIDWRSGVWSATISGSFILSILLGVLALAWMFRMTLNAWQGLHVEPIEALKGSLRAVLPVGVALVLIYVGMFAVLAVAIVLVPVFGVIGILFMVPGQFVLNLLAFTLIAPADYRLRYMGGTARWFHSLRLGLRSWRRLFWPTLVGSLVLGGFVFISWSGSTYDPATAQISHKSVTHFQMHTFPVCDFRETCHWYSDWAAKTGAPKEALTSYFFSLLMVLWSTLVIVRFTKEWCFARQEYEDRAFDTDYL